MKPEDQIKALAELDGFTELKQTWDDDTVWFVGIKGTHWRHCENIHRVPFYLTSYDAIIPLIQNQCLGSERTEAEFVFQLGKAVMSSYSQIQLVGFTSLGATPHQLSQALLKATGKWVE